MLAVVVIQSAQGFNLFEFLQRKFSNVRPAYQPPPPQQRVQHERRPGEFFGHNLPQFNLRSIKTRQVQSRLQFVNDQFYTNGRKTTYHYEAIFLVNEILTAYISYDL